MISFGLYKIAPFHHSKATMDRYNHKSITPIDIIYRIIYELICTQNGFQQKEIWTRDIVAPIKKKTKISVVKQLSFFFFFIKALFFFFFFNFISNQPISPLFLLSFSNVAIRKQMLVKVEM
jgi:hypothetical protein